MSVLRRRLLLGGLAGGGKDDFHLTANPTAVDLNVRLQTITCGVPTVIAWGDGATTNVPANTDTDVTHTYGAAGSYRITIPRASKLTKLQLEDAKLGGLNTRELRRSVLTYWRTSVITDSVINSADMVDWRPTDWLLFNMPVGGSYAINTADMVDWRPDKWNLFSMPVGGSYIINTADWTAWNPRYFRIPTMPVGDTVWTIAANDFAGWVRCSEFYAQDNGLSTTQVNAILWGMYQAATARTVSGGGMQLGGPNAAPSGTFQAATSCPVTVATPGKEITHELLNNGCGGVNLGRVWATVNITA